MIIPFEKTALKQEIDELRTEIEYLRKENLDLKADINYLRRDKEIIRNEVTEEKSKVKTQIQMMLEKIEKEYQGHFYTLHGRKLSLEENYSVEINPSTLNEIQVRELVIPESRFIYVEELPKPIKRVK